MEDRALSDLAVAPAAGSRRRAALLALGWLAGHGGWVGVPSLLGVWSPLATALLSAGALGGAVIGARRRSAVALVLGPSLTWSVAAALWAPEAFIGGVGVGAAFGGLAYLTAALHWARPSPRLEGASWQAMGGEGAPAAPPVPVWLPSAVIAGCVLGVVMWPGLLAGAQVAYPSAPGVASAVLVLSALAAGLVLAARLASLGQPRPASPGRAMALAVFAATCVGLWTWWRA